MEGRPDSKLAVTYSESIRGDSGELGSASVGGKLGSQANIVEFPKRAKLLKMAKDDP